MGAWVWSARFPGSPPTSSPVLPLQSRSAPAARRDRSGRWTGTLGSAMKPRHLGVLLRECLQGGKARARRSQPRGRSTTSQAPSACAKDSHSRGAENVLWRSLPVRFVRLDCAVGSWPGAVPACSRRRASAAPPQPFPPRYPARAGPGAADQARVTTPNRVRERRKGRGLAGRTRCERTHPRRPGQCPGFFSAPQCVGGLWKRKTPA